MTDLDQLLTEAFERRAASASGALSTDKVRGAIRRRRNRTLRMTAALTGVTLASAGTLIAATRPAQHRSDGVGGVGGIGVGQGWQSAVGSFTPIVQLPATGTPLVSVARIDQKKPSRGTYYELCSDKWCQGTDLVGKTVTEEGHGGEVYGLAAAGTARVMVSVAGAAYVQAQLAEIPDPPHALLYALAGVSRNVGSSTFVTHTVRVAAVDGSGRVTSAVEVLGSEELAWRHPPAGPTLTLPTGNADVGGLAWMAADGWSCEGNRVVQDGRTIYGATQCQLPKSPMDVLEVMASNQLGKASKVLGGWTLLRVPTSVRQATWQLAGHSPVPATILSSAHGSALLVTVQGRDADNPAAVITGTDNAGNVVFTRTVRQLLDGMTALSRQGSGRAAPVHVTLPVH